MCKPPTMGTLKSSAVPQKGLHIGREPESTPDDQSSPSPSRLRWPKRTNKSGSCRLRRGEIPSSIARIKGECHGSPRCLKWMNMMVCNHTCEHSSSAFSSAAFRWLWSGCDSGVFSKICRSKDSKVRKMCVLSTELGRCVCVCLRPAYVLYDERVAGDPLHGFKQEAGQRHALTPGIHG